MAIRRVRFSARDSAGLIGSGSTSFEAVAANAGAPQYPALLNGYAVRPPWQVAAVDYRVGVTPGTVLRNPATMSNTEFAAAFPNCGRDVGLKQFYVNGTATISAIDLSGWQGLVYHGNNVTFLNSKVTRGSIEWRTDGGGVLPVGGTIRFCEFDGEAAVRCPVTIYRPGIFTVENSVFMRARAMTFQITNGSPGQSFYFRRNLVAHAGCNAAGGDHGDWNQMFGGYTVDEVVIDDNTFYQDIGPGMGSPGAATQGISLNAQTPTIRKGSISRNVMVARTNTNKGIILLRRWVDGAFPINDNYVAPHYPMIFAEHDYDGPPTPPHPSAWNTITKTGNRNMITGGSIA